MKKNLMKLVLCGSMLSVLAACGNKAADTKASTAQESVKESEKQSEKATEAASEKAEEKKEEAKDLADVKTETVYVGPEYVKELMDSGEDVVVLEAAWGKVEQDEAYNKAHIPGAFHVNTDDIEEDETWNFRTPEEIGKLLKSYGITKDTKVVTYGNSPENAADDRLAMVLLWAGVEDVKNLSGGIDAWTKAGYETETKVNQPVATDKDFGVKIPAHPEYILSIDEVKEKQKDDPKFKLVSIRSKDEFLGKTSGYSYIDRAGEPLGAVWGHDTDDGSYNNPDGSIVSLEKLESYLGESGVSLEKNDVAFYCGTGWRASVPFLIAHENGYKNAYLYDGGWYVWQMDGENKVQLGEPGSSDYKEVLVKDLSTDKAKK